MNNKIIVCMLLYYGTIFGQGNIINKQVLLQNGYPKVVKQFFDFYGQYKQSEVKTAKLNTGIDTLQVYFGIADNNKNKFYWSALTNNDSLLTLTSGFLLKNKAPNVSTGSSELVLGEKRPEKIKFAIHLNEDTNILSYKWLNLYNKPIKIMEIIKNNKFELGNQLPNLTFNKLDGKKINLKMFEGKIIVLNWWNTYCKPCIAEMPGLNKIVEKYSSNKNIVFIAIADNTQDQIKKFLTKRKFEYEQYVTSSHTKNFFELSYPKHFIVGNDGKIKFFLEGGGKETYKEIDLALDKLIKIK
ncbi:TlpA disulfide reductase family protein [Aureibaculum sp. 2210JD6-5]|uniref:TlpA family protein disulfide reductase n=1 Tax=Aureibaculum sp. 2210JD6-5 TaxID=3103957 RepID=UPI002AAD6F34|nr:TlpA disulfide reductase family protein [Aureibaculum sp. 2210JD6-5]MDY7395281.1 TlpA disulfide reductase family protein [Aureibaculum sp. 2210JD6-5]